MVKECIKKPTKSLSTINLITSFPIDWIQNGCRGALTLPPHLLKACLVRWDRCGWLRESDCVCMEVNTHMHV